MKEEVEVTEEQAIVWCTIMWEEIYKTVDFNKESIQDGIHNLKDEAWIEVCNYFDLDEDTCRRVEDNSTCPCCAYVNTKSMADSTMINGACQDACLKYCPGMPIWGEIGGGDSFHPCMGYKRSPYRKLNNFPPNTERVLIEAIQEIAEGFRYILDEYKNNTK